MLQSTHADLKTDISLYSKTSILKRKKESLTINFPGLEQLNEGVKYSNLTIENKQGGTNQLILVKYNCFLSL